MGHNAGSGFTLIELSIVLVIIGLIVGGILVGQDLIRAAAVRAQIAQIEKYQTAVNTFRLRYNELPGDMDNAARVGTGFASNSGTQGCGDGNGLIEGSSPGVPAWQQPGETTMFWVDLTLANGQNLALIDGDFTNQSNANCATGVVLGSAASGTRLNSWFPQAKIGNGNYIYVYSMSNHNYFGISAVTSLRGLITSSTGMTAQQALSIDSKIDDGLPQSGRVLAYYADLNTFHTSANGWQTSGWAAANTIGPNPGSAAPALVTSCYDNGGSNGVSNYSMEVNGGSGINCAISFQFQ